jgi:8-oxo-dGTP diphosphatase
MKIGSKISDAPQLNCGDTSPFFVYGIILNKSRFCGIIIYLDSLEVLAMTEVVAALIWNEDKFMICQRPAHKARGLLWEFVGGKVEPGETKEQALIRECREELAVTLTVGDIFMDVVHEYPDLTVHLTLFNATIADGEPQKLEHNDIQWITPSEIPNYEFCPADVEILARICEVHQ